MNSPAKENTRLLAAALLIACPDLDISKAKKVLLPSMAHTKLERDLHRWDLHEMPSKYKFGALTVQPGQTKEEQWFSNTGTTDAYDTFLNILGRRIQLRGFQGYPAGLDTFTGESGETSVISSWQHYEMMFHVAALMPFRPNDRQQVHRKRYLGNDIVCVVFLDGPDALFDPTAIKSKFLHVYILVQPVSPQGWRVEVVRKQAVPEFGPPLPNPPIFDDPQRLHEFLAVKCKVTFCGSGC
ncbi:hypothetical protein DM01DRAFT_1282914 [Hesseltinella vesiculosa]|uniref:Rap-GAP domain-containing protein n=1 Tax=Hesseltinella vesiculosa TaxID=101127 RepID=A0A1X2GQJ2_9FUNG|nr:hypothetical protein DM01DRAFT_1282914 [Hesseltinella vesiculosa]